MTPTKETPWWAWAGWFVAVVLGISQLANVTRNSRMSAMLGPESATATRDRITRSAAPDTDGVLAEIRSEVTALGRELQNTRKASESEHHSAFAILRDELSRKSKELEDIQLGNDYRSRRPTLIALARAFDIISQDQQSQGVPAESTLQGVASELREALEDHGIRQLTYPPGTLIGQAAGVDVKNSTHLPSRSDDDKGKVLETIRPAYVLEEGNEIRDVLIQSLVRYYA
jgi:hypothetical protein